MRKLRQTNLLVFASLVAVSAIAALVLDDISSPSPQEAVSIATYRAASDGLGERLNTEAAPISVRVFSDTGSWFLFQANYQDRRWRVDGVKQASSLGRPISPVQPRILTDGEGLELFGIVAWRWAVRGTRYFAQTRSRSRCYDGEHVFIQIHAAHQTREIVYADGCETPRGLNAALIRLIQTGGLNLT